MKKRKIAISAALVALAAAAPLTLAACSGDNYSKISFAAQDTSYTVTSQGGSAVAYGNNIYFINGYRGYDDTNGNANVWGDVVKGGLYRAELNGSKYTDAALTLFDVQYDPDGSGFKYTKGTDYFDNEINVVGTTQIAPKTVGTSGYSQGGIFIYDNYAYFASPNNQKNKTGTVQTIRTDFFMMPLSGGKPTKIYTSTEKVDTSSSAYAFYKYNGSVYLVVNEGSDIVSVKIDTRKAEADDPVFFHVGATSVYFPVKDTYYNGISTNTPEDFIYFVRAVGDDDNQRSGTVIEAMRPDGSENFKVSMTGATETIEAVRDGLLFYRSTEVGKTYIKYTNMHDMLMDFSPSYKAGAESSGVRQISGKFPTEITSSITSTYAFRPDLNGNEPFFIGVTSTGMTLYQNDAQPVRLQNICSDDTGTALYGTIQFVKNNYVYFAGSGSQFYRAPLFSNMDGFGTAQLLAENTSSATFGCDYAEGYFTYYAQVDEWATGYAFFSKIDGVEGAEPIFVGSRAAADIPTEEQIENVKNGSTTTE